MNVNDVASDVEELHRTESVARARADMPILKPTGKCLWCGESIHPTAINQRFCDSEHRDEYDFYIARHPELRKK